MENMMVEKKKISLEKIIELMLMIFIIIQPILDCYMVLFDSKIQIFGNSLATIVRFLWVAIMVCMTMYVARKKKNTLFFIGYIVIVGIYAILHHINALKVNVALNDEAIYSFIGEMAFIARMVVPVAIIYILINIKMKYETIKKIIISLVILICVIMLITNLFGVDNIAYAFTNTGTSGNIISWFTEEINPVNWKMYTSRGIFTSANQLSAIMVMLLPIVIYIALKEKKLYYMAVVLIQMISMLMLSTRIAVICEFAIIAGMLLMYIILCLFNKEKINYIKIACLIFVAIISGLIYLKSPFAMRNAIGDVNFGDISEKQASNNDSEIVKKYDFNNDEEKIQYVLDNYEKSGIRKVFVEELYKVEQDPDFWVNIINKVPYWKRFENRGMKTLLLQRVKELNNNSIDTFLGMSFMKISYFIWPERDFEAQYYTLGIVGMLLLIGPYIVTIIYCGIQLLKKFKKKFNIQTGAYMAGLIFILFAGYFSGHVLEEIFVSILIGFVCGINVRNAIDDE